MDWICSPGILPSPKDQSVLLREAILGAVDKLIFVYNLSQTIQMIGWFFISLCIQGNMKNWGLGIFAGSARRLAGPLSALGHAPHQRLPSEEWWEYYTRLFPVTPHPPLPPSSFFLLTTLIHMATRWRESERASEVKLDRAPWSGVPFLTLDICPLLMIDSRSDMTPLVPLGPVYCFCHPKPAPPPALPHTLAQNTIRNTHTLICWSYLRWHPLSKITNTTNGLCFVNVQSI